MQSKFIPKMNIVELTKYETDALKRIHTKDGTNLTDLISKLFSGPFDKTGPTKYVICLQGSSSSGKSTVAQSIVNLLHEAKIKTYLLQIDKCYRSFVDMEGERGGEYEAERGSTPVEERFHTCDFDNPNAIDWGKVGSILDAIHEDKPFIPTYEYSFHTKTASGPFYIKNEDFKVVVVEGIYGFNSLSSKMFNLREFDPFESTKKIKDEFIDNKKTFKNFRIMKIRLSMCKTKSRRVRISRDIVERNKTRREALRQFYDQVWPATHKWVNSSVFEEDIKIVHGSFNMKKEISCDRNFLEQFYSQCTKECLFKSKSFLVLRDD